MGISLKKRARDGFHYIAMAKGMSIGRGRGDAIRALLPSREAGIIIPFMAAAARA